MLHGDLPSNSSPAPSHGAEVKNPVDYRLYLLSNNDSKSLAAAQELVPVGNAVLLFPDTTDESKSTSRKYKACFIQNGKLRELPFSKTPEEVTMGNRIIKTTDAQLCDMTSEPNAANLIKAALARAGIVVAPVLKTPQQVFRAQQVANLDAKSLASFASTSFYANKLITQSMVDQKAVKKLIDHILGGEMAEVKKMLDASPHLALVKYEAAKEAEKVTTNKGNQRIQIHGKTAYQVALGEEDTEMAAMLKACIIKAADEKEANDQYNAQYPKGWEKEEEKRWEPLFTELKMLTEVIRNNPGDILSSGDPEYKLTISEESKVGQALTQYRKAWDAILNKPVTTGRHYNPKLLQQTFQTYDDHFHDYFGNYWINPRALCFWQRVIGYAERPMPANYVQAFCYGLNNTIEKLKKSEPHGRSFQFELYDTEQRKWILVDFYPLSSSRLGSDFAIRVWRVGGGGGRGWAAGGGRDATCFEAYVNQKQQDCRAYTTPRQST